MAQRNRQLRKIKLIFFAAVAIIAIVITAAPGLQLNFVPTWNEIFTALELEPEGNIPADSGGLTVHFIDVGQADAILVTCEGQSLLIDAGGNQSGNPVVSYLKKAGVTKLNYAIGTHPHEDHIGGLDTVVNAMDVDTILMPKIPDSIVPATKTYTDVLQAIQGKGRKITIPVAGTVYKLGKAKLTLLGPVQTYNDLNDLSIVCHIEYGSTSFLFTGDAEKKAEQDILNIEKNSLKATVLKMGHHGSRTSSSKDFLDAVSPKYAVISCGKDNDYGHPHQETLDALAGRNITLFRTDQNGSIVMSSDGTKIAIKTERQ